MQLQLPDLTHLFPVHLDNVPSLAFNASTHDSFYRPMRKQAWDKSRQLGALQCDSDSGM